MGCCRFQVKPYSSTNHGPLPKDKTTPNESCAAVTVDFVGPIKYRGENKQVVKAYLVTYACSLTRGVHLELLSSLETKVFLRRFKKFIIQRGRPSVLYSDNGLIFKAVHSDANGKNNSLNY